MLLEFLLAVPCVFPLVIRQFQFRPTLAFRDRRRYLGITLFGNPG